MFYKYIPFQATIFMVRLKFKSKKHEKNLSLSRKALHFLANNAHFKDKPLFLLINIDNGFLLPED